MNFSSLLKRSALAAVLLAIAALPMSSGVKREVRSVWMATVWALDWPSSTSSTTAQKTRWSSISTFCKKQFQRRLFPGAHNE